MIGDPSEDTAFLGAPEGTTTTEQGYVALFIDWENVRYSLRRLNEKPDMASLVRAAEAYGPLLVARAYSGSEDFDSSRYEGRRLPRDTRWVAAVGVEAVWVPSRFGPRSELIDNSVDVKMAVDCIETSFTLPQITTFVLVSGDHSMRHIVDSLKARDKACVVIGVQGSVARSLGEAADELILYRDITESLRVAPSLPPRDVRALVDAVVGLVRESAEQGHALLLNELGLRFRERFPHFNPLDYRASKFSDIVRKLEQTGFLRLVAHQHGTVVLPPSHEPPDELPDLGDASEGDQQKEEEEAHNIQGGAELLEQYRDVFADIVRVANELEDAHTLSTADSLTQQIWRRARSESSQPSGSTPISATSRALSKPQLRRFVTLAIKLSLLETSAEVDTRLLQTVVAVRLNRCHPFVTEVLAHSS